jgi:hypothetical protein
VFRAAVVWIVVAVAGAPNTSLLCRTWCDAQAPAVPGCHHHQAPVTPTRVTSADSCERMVLSIAPFVRENLSHGAVAPDTAQATVVRHDPLADAASRARRCNAPQSNRPFARRPNLAALRI